MLDRTTAVQPVARSPKGHALYPVITLTVLTLFIEFVALRVSYNEENEEPHDVQKPEQSSNEQDHRHAV